jgi:aminoglycoside phosphotransferase (APT) family kinase protein
MWRVAADDRSLDDVARTLAAHHGVSVAAIAELVPLRGGYWSSAYAYRHDGRDLVARFGSDRGSFEADRNAMSYARPGLPVPEVLDIIGDGDRWLAISVRHRGTFLEELDPEQAGPAAPSIERMLASLRSVQGPAGVDLWHAWLLDGLVDHPSRAVNGWRATMSDDIGALFDAAVAEVRRLVPACPERRDLVHGDLLHQNVLVDDDRVSAVFSWKCSTFGDFLYDAAWCDFWSPWHPGIEALDVVGRTLAAPDLTASDRVAATARLRCYLLHIGATHLAWCTWTGGDDDLRAVAARSAALLG